MIRKRSSAGGDRIRNHPHRNSASVAITGTGGHKMYSTVQEDLMKLIGPSNLQNGELSTRSNTNAEDREHNRNQDVSFIQKPVRSRSKVILNFEVYFSSLCFNQTNSGKQGF